MFIDARTLPSNHELRGDICIVGAGPAGITLALEFLADPRRRVILLDAGGLDTSDENGDELDIPCKGDAYDNPRFTRSWRFGGTAFRWNTPVSGEFGAKYTPLDAIDFQRRDWIPHSGWPFDRAHLDPFYKRAHELCRLKPLDYESNRDVEGAGGCFCFADARAKSGLYQLGKSSVFLRDFREKIERAENIHCFYNAIALEIISRPQGNAVGSIRLVDAAGKPLVVHAEQFILAAGGLENPRLLLASNAVQKTGIGNSRDLVGRFLMDHPIWNYAHVLPLAPGVFRRMGFFDIHMQGDAEVLGRMTLDSRVLQEEKLLNFSMVLFPEPGGFRSRGAECFRRLRDPKFYKISRAEQMKLGLQFLSDLHNVLPFVYRRITKKYKLPYHFWSRVPHFEDLVEEVDAQFYLEQAPDPQNRIMLTQQRSRFGLPKTEIFWRTGELTRRTADRAVDILDEELHKAGIGRMKRLEYPHFQGSGHHHMGTTRMHQNPNEGVVDANGLVHGMGNLFVAGPSLFPTGGFANPILTIVALSIRLADHLKKIAAIPSL